MGAPAANAPYLFAISGKRSPQVLWNLRETSSRALGTPAEPDLLVSEAVRSGMRLEDRLQRSHDSPEVDLASMPQPAC
jgi:hypothetical protein